MWNCTHFRQPTDEQLRHVDIYSLATNIIGSLSTLNLYIEYIEKRKKKKISTLHVRKKILLLLNPHPHIVQLMYYL